MLCQDFDQLFSAAAAAPYIHSFTIVFDRTKMEKYAISYHDVFIYT